MTPWTGIALALTEPGGDGMESRLSTYFHPVAGRPLAWHTLSCISSLHPAPSRSVLLARGEINPELLVEYAADVEPLGPAHGNLWQAVEALDADTEHNLLLAEAAAPVSGPELQRLVDGPADRVLLDINDRVVAAWLSAERGRELLSGVEELAALSAAIRTNEASAAGHVSLVVRDRVTLAGASALIRDRLVERLMRGGVTFLLPETTLVDVDVRIGKDAVIYPGVVLEGQTTIGEETVVGPGCRIIDSWIGSGVELKGWNYVSHTSVRNRAILEPYVRRGFD